MDIFVAVLLALQQATFGVLASVIALKHRARVRYAIVFGILSLLGIALAGWQALITYKGTEETRKELLGDPERPPFVTIMSLPGVTHFVTLNNSDYPAYGTKIQLHDETHKTSPVRNYEYAEMAAHLGIIDYKAWSPDDDASEHRFGVDITTRTGLVFEDLVLRRAGNGQWMRASRVRQGMRTLEEDVDSSWPRDQNGQPDWK